MISLPMLGDFLGYVKPALYDDVADRLNYFATPVLLIFFTFCVMGKQYIGSPIQCFIPAEFKGGWEQYAEDYCFIQNTYYVPLHMDIPNDVEKRENREIGYYQWIPVVLALQAVLFYLPFFFWKTAAWQTGVNVESILARARKVAEGGETSEEELGKLASLMEANLGSAAELARHRRLLCVRFSPKGGLGSYCTLVYLLMKALNTANVVLQFYIMNEFLGTEYRFWGLEVLVDLVQGREWHDSGHFPRVTLCDFAVRRLGQVQKYSIQCVLMMNMFNEKIYIFLWFWMLMVGVVTSVNLLYWLLTTLLPSSRESQVGRYLAIGKGLDERDSRALRPSVRRFAERWLRVDGLLLLRFIAAHNGDIVSTELCRCLFDHYVHNSKLAQPRRALHQADHGGLLHDGRSDSTKSSSAHDDDGFAEDLYDPPAKKGDAPLLPSAPQPPHHPRGYPGPPLSPPKSPHDVV